MENSKIKTCKHSFDVLSIVWGEGGKRGFPCKKCGELLKIGTVKIIENKLGLTK